MIVGGLGLSERATRAELQALLTAVAPPPMHLAVLRQKAAFPVLQSLASNSGLSVISLDEGEIVGEQVLTHSQRIQNRFGTGSVAEALALVAARRFGPARLLGPRHISPGGLATLALAETTS